MANIIEDGRSGGYFELATLDYFDSVHNGEGSAGGEQLHLENVQAIRRFISARQEWRRKQPEAKIISLRTPEEPAEIIREKLDFEAESSHEHRQFWSPILTAYDAVAGQLYSEGSMAQERSRNRESHTILPTARLNKKQKDVLDALVGATNISLQNVSFIRIKR